ncbi:MAG: DNA-binding response regulator [Deltaproteobacteria bacterium HGW-Deltaproteobacteria-24]|jgi:DNA-binding response OmpR family regulator|nr:MAG: DNA-binding response regulator [Deltaproteobacteria bacterium HGW-Deltaproteobacteria-24]
MARNLLLLKSKTVLFAEDDKIMQTQITEVLEMLFKEVFSAEDGEKAYEFYEDKSPDIIISDIKMPKMDGLTFIEKVRKTDYNTPIIVLTNFNEKEYLSHAVNLSIDGYILKPIEFNTLTQTIIKALKRVQNNSEIVFLAPDLFFDFKTQEIYLKDQLISLGVKELDLLKLLIRNHSRTVTKEEISENLWPLDDICESAIKNLILRIRKKLHNDIIVSVRGIGYRLNICTG